MCFTMVTFWRLKWPFWDLIEHKVLKLTHLGALIYVYYVKYVKFYYVKYVNLIGNALFRPYFWP